MTSGFVNYHTPHLKGLSGDELIAGLRAFVASKLGDEVEL
jgi:hypothetical protein